MAELARFALPGQHCQMCVLCAANARWSGLRVLGSRSGFPAPVVLGVDGIRQALEPAHVSVWISHRDTY